MDKIVPFTVNMMKIKYCEFNKNRCIRYKLLNEFEMVDIPHDLWPADEQRAFELMETKLHGTSKKRYE